MSTFSIAGNENFTMVENSAGVFQNIQSSSEQIVESNIQNLTVYDENFANEVVGLGTIKTVTGYAPTNFGTLTNGQGVLLNRLPKQAAATSETDDQLLKLPVGARIIGMRLTNNGTKIRSPSGTVGGSTVSLSMQEWIETPAPLSGDSLAKETPTGANEETKLRGVNSPAGVKFWPTVLKSTGTVTNTTTGAVTVMTSRMTLGTTGEEQGGGGDDEQENSSVLVEEGKQFVGVQLALYPNEKGDLAAKLWYIAP